MAKISASSMLPVLNIMKRSVKNKNRALNSISSGEKINSSGDDPSAFQISERMRIQIRALDQCRSNSDNANSMLKIAEGAIQQQLEIMKRIRTLIMQASDGTKGSADLKIIQREIESQLLECEDIAVKTTYNGLPLLDSYDTETPYRFDGYYIPNAKLYTVNDNEPGDTVDFFPDMTGNDKWIDLAEKNFPEHQGENVGLGYTFDFSAVDKVLVDGGADAIHMQGMSLNCDACPQFFTILFDAKKKVNDSEFFGSAAILADRFLAEPGCYVVGIEGINNGKDLAKAMFDGMEMALKKRGLLHGGSNGTTDNLLIGAKHDFSLLYDNANGKLSLTKNTIDIKVLNGCRGVQMVNHWGATQTLSVQSGTRSSQNINLHLPCTRLSENFKDVLEDELTLTTKNNAKKFLDHVDWAISYYLESITTVGAQRNRLEYTSDNLMISAENTTSAESTIRDSNVASEMTKLIKDNILLQSSQMMLAQSNQNLSNVLQLLH